MRSIETITFLLISNTLIGLAVFLTTTQIGPTTLYPVLVLSLASVLWIIYSYVTVLRSLLYVPPDDTVEELYDRDLDLLENWEPVPPEDILERECQMLTDWNPWNVALGPDSYTALTAKDIGVVGEISDLHLGRLAELEERLADPVYGDLRHCRIGIGQELRPDTEVLALDQEVPDDAMHTLRDILQDSIRTRERV